MELNILTSQLTSSYMMATLAFNELITLLPTNGKTMNQGSSV